MEGSSSTLYNDLSHILSDPEDEPPLPAPMTTRNRIPRSRATSLARSRGSSRASSISGSRNGSIVARAGSRPESRAGHRDIAANSYGGGGGTADGLYWESGIDMDSLDDELGYVGVGSSSAGSSRSAQLETEYEPAMLVPMSSKAKGKKRARSTPETEDEATARTKARLQSPIAAQNYSQDTPLEFHDQAYSFHPTTFSFSTQSQADEPPPTQSTLLSNSSGSVTLGSSTTMGSTGSIVPMGDLALEGSTTYPPLSSFDNYEFDFGFTTASSGLESASEQSTHEPAAPSVGSSNAGGLQGASSKGKSPQTNYGGTADSSASASALYPGQEGGTIGSSSSSTVPPPAGSSSSSSSSGPATSSSRPPRLPTPPAQPDPLSSYTCPICFFPPSNATLTPCGHICCGSCLFTAIKSSQSRNGMGFSHSAFTTNGEALCPVCRAAIPGWDGKGGGVIGLRVRSVISI